MTGRYAAKPSLSLKALAMGLVTLFFAALVVYQQALFSPARAAWDSGDTVDRTGTVSIGNYFRADASDIIIPNNSAFTVEAMVKPSEVNGLDTIVHQNNRGGTADTIGFWMGMLSNGDYTTNRIRLVLDGAGGPQEVNWDLGANPRGTWTHLAMTFSTPGGGASSVKLFVNGQLKQTTDATDSATVTPPSFSAPMTNPFEIGGRQGEDDLSFAGQIDQVKVWNTALDDAQIAKSKDSWGSKHGTTEITGDSAHLVAHYDFNQSDGSTLFNRVQNSNHLEEVGNPDLSAKAPRLLIDPSRSVVINDFAAVTNVATSVTGTISTSSSTADYYLRLEAEAGSLNVSNLNGADAQDTSTNGSVGTEDYQGTKNITLRGTEAELQAALDATTFTATSAGSRKLFVSLTPVLDGTNLGSIVQLSTTGHLYNFSSENKTWASHKDSAASVAYLGNAGYLTTLTSAAENLALTRPAGTWLSAGRDDGLAPPNEVWTWGDGISFVTPKARGGVGIR